MSERVIRINKVLRELNISLDRAVEFLKTKGFDIEASPNAKISDDEYAALDRQFSADKGKKQSSKEVNEKRIQNLINKNLERITTTIKIDKEILKSYLDYKSISLDVNDEKEITDIISSCYSFFNNYKPKNIIDFEKNINQKIYPWFEDIPNHVSSFNQLENKICLRLVNVKIKLSSIDYNDIMELEITDSEVSYDATSIRDNSLNSLSITNCNLNNINFLKFFPKLEYINLCNNNISEIEVLSRFNSLETLDLSFNLITDIYPIKYLEIDNLYLNSNLIDDFTPLYNSLTRYGLSELNVNENRLSEYPPYNDDNFDGQYIIDWFTKVFNNVNKIITNVNYNQSKVLDLGLCGLTDLEIISDLFFENNHIEELILSNEYSFYDDENEVFIRKMSENKFISYNRITNLTTALEKFKNLKKLVIGGNWKEGDVLRKYSFTDINQLSNLSSLEYLNISNGVLASLKGLEKLTNLKSLFANNNNISDIKPIITLNRLEELYIGNNYVKDLNPLDKLRKLKTIDFHSNVVSDIRPLKFFLSKLNSTYSKWKKGCINIYNNPLDEVFVNLVKENENTINNLDFNNYIKRLFQGDTIKINQLKLILLGNTRCGKTTLADSITNNNLADGSSTHGLNFFNYEYGNVELKGFDFGGQDYYHNTHFAFFDTSSVYFFVWGNNQEDIFKKNANDEMLFPLNYWLGSLNEFRYNQLIDDFYNSIITKKDFGKELESINGELTSYKLPIITKNYEKEINEFKKINNKSFFSLKIILNAILEKLQITLLNKDKIDGYIIQNIYDKKKFLNEKDIVDNYDFIDDFKAFNLLKDRTDLSLFIKDLLENKKKEYIKPNLDYELAISFSKSDNVIYRIEDLKESFQNLQELDVNEIESLIIGLHSILACYYFKIDEFDLVDQFNDLKNIVITDIQKFTDWIYKIFESKDSNQKIRASKNKGYFDRDEALSWLENDSEAKLNIDYILAFMLANKIIFKVKNSNKYFAPNYLTESLTRSEELLFRSFEKPIIKYSFSDFFHTSILSDIISEFMNSLVFDSENLKYLSWKNKVLLYNELKSDDLIFLNFSYESCDPRIEISVNSKTFEKEFINDLSDFIELKIKYYNYSKLLLSKSGDYVPIEIILENNSLNQNVFSYNNRFFTVTEFSYILNNISLKMKKIFISYSKDDLQYVNEFLKHLSPLKRDGIVGTWYCTELVAGGNWNADIQRKFEESDIILYFVSPNLLNTDYVYNYEIKKAFEKKEKNENFKIVPIILDYCSWITRKYNLGDFSALPYTAKPVKDFRDRNMAYFVIVEAIKHMINNDSQLTQEDWFNQGDHVDKISKQVKSIYERIVRGDVDNNNSKL